jgi:hypothetical protein
MIDDYDVMDELQDSDDIYKELGDGELKAGKQAVYIDRYTMNHNSNPSSKYHGKPQLIINLFGCDDNVGNRGDEASVYFPIVTSAWAKEEPNMKRQARFMKAFFSGLGIKDFKVSMLKTYLEEIRKMPFMANITKVDNGFAQLETMGFCDGTAVSHDPNDAPF